MLRTGFQECVPNLEIGNERKKPLSSEGRAVGEKGLTMPQDGSGLNSTALRANLKSLYFHSALIEQTFRKANCFFHDLTKQIQRTPHPPAAPVQHMRVNHRRGHILVAQQLLHGADVITPLQQMRGEAVPQGMR